MRIQNEQRRRNNTTNRTTGSDHTIMQFSFKLSNIYDRRYGMGQTVPQSACLKQKYRRYIEDCMRP